MATSKAHAKAAAKSTAKPSKPFKPNAPAVSGTDGRPAKMHVNPPRLPSLQKHLKGMPMPIRVNVRPGMGAPKGKAGKAKGAAK